ncbi:hypothetical protein KVT40_000101 [Elsinoe batatas]|uniref:Uncharacterized protein n=1 Tax=Elsinoe batatas TaxID=2601811 RepID=A0A8K0PIB3_9PEZI|nr:hypothetical protein KVT40_000101 [Elsinoe batatas]
MRDSGSVLDAIVDMRDGWPNLEEHMCSSAHYPFDFLRDVEELPDSCLMRDDGLGDENESEEPDLDTMIHWPGTEELVPAITARVTPSTNENHGQSGPQGSTSYLLLEQPPVPTPMTETPSDPEPDTHTATFTFRAPLPPPSSPKKIRLHPRRRRRHRSIDMSQPKNMIAAKWHERVASSRDADDQSKE